MAHGANLKLSCLMFALSTAMACQGISAPALINPSTLQPSITVTSAVSTATSPPKASDSLPKDCADVQLTYGNRSNGIYKVSRPGCSSNPSLCSFSVLCDLQTDSGGWTYLQQRVDGTVDFFHNWADYKNGFGNLIDNFWAGNQYAYELTSQSADNSYELLIQLQTFDGVRVTALYDKISIQSEADSYKLVLGNLFQDGSSIDNLAGARNQPFSTFDKDSGSLQGVVCSSYWNSGWWHSSSCGYAGDLNGPYSPVSTSPQLVGIVWQGVTGNSRINQTQMKIRPSNFIQRLNANPPVSTGRNRFLLRDA